MRPRFPDYRAAFGLLLLLGPTTASAQRLGQGAAPEVSIVRIIAALAVGVIIAVLAILFIRNRQGRGLPFDLRRLRSSQAQIEVVESRRISPHAEACLIRHDGREYLLLVSQSHSQVLREREVSQSLS